MYPYILFDLDGTLCDSGLGITKSVAYALEKFGIHVDDLHELEPFVGPPLADSFMERYHFTPEQAMLGIKYYREYYQNTGIFEQHVYPGIEELLKTLKEQGHHLLVATSKPEEFSTRILDHFHLSEYFEFIGGATMDEKRTKKEDVILYGLSTCGITDTSTCLMIGDRKFDVLGAKALGMDSVGVLYGYGTREELENAGATYIAASASDILHFV